MASFVRCWLLSLVQYPTSPNVGDSGLSIVCGKAPIGQLGLKVSSQSTTLRNPIVAKVPTFETSET